MTRYQAFRRIAHRGLAAGALAAAVSAMPALASADPSFDCSRATEHVEFMICERPALAKLDRQIASIYFALLENAPPPQAERIRQEQRDFLHYRNMCASSAGLPSQCVESRLWQRLAELQQLHTAMSGTPLVSGGEVTTAPGLVWRAATANTIAPDAYRLDNGAILCAVGLPDAPVIGTAAVGGCRIARGGRTVEEPTFHTLTAGTAAYGWTRAAGLDHVPSDAVPIWRDGDRRVLVCRTLLDGTYAVGTMTVGEACVVLFEDDAAEPAVEEVLVLAGFEVMTEAE
ncbi:MAG: lysozyme inhibitor LprI family protein [Alphaproteobacteria bacterium]